MGKEGLKAYFASDLGFRAASRRYMNEECLPKMTAAGIQVANPWDLVPQQDFWKLEEITDPKQHLIAEKNLRNKIGHRNMMAIKHSTIVIANVDGVEVDAGVAAEIGCAATLEKPVFAWRDDLRNSGELGAKISLQVEYFINASSGGLFSSLDETLEEIKKRYPRALRPQTLL